MADTVAYGAAIRLLLRMRQKTPRENLIAGQGAVLATAFFWSTSGLFIKLIDWHPVVISGARSFVAALFLLFIRAISPPPNGVKNAAFPLWAGAFANAFTMLCFVIANKLTTSANVILLQYGAPVWAALLGWRLIKEKPRWEHWGALCLVIGGLFLFFKDSLGSSALLGDGLAVLSGMLFGAQTVFLRMMKDGNPRDSLLLSHIINAAIGIPFMFLYPPALSVLPVLSIVYMGIMQMGLAAVLFSYGIKRITAIQAMLIATAEPLLNPLWVFIVIGEKPSPAALAGGAVIIAAVAASALIGIRRNTNASGFLPEDTDKKADRENT